jgi:cysteine desulfurase / selenocysteine lyase
MPAMEQPLSQQMAIPNMSGAQAGTPSPLDVIAQLANQLYQAPYGAPATPTSAAPVFPSSTPADSVPSAPISLAPTPDGHPGLTSVPNGPTSFQPHTSFNNELNPFTAPLNLDAVFTQPEVDASNYQVPLQRQPSITPSIREARTLDASKSRANEPHPSASLFDAYALKQEFPILRETVNGKRLVWLDNAATTQKPDAVIDRLSDFYRRENSNIHRAAHTLAARATDAYEKARESVRRFVGAESAGDVIFVRGATEGINLVAQSWGKRNIREGDEIVISWLEHHANIVPWQMLCEQTGARLRVAPVDERGQVLLEDFERLLGPRTRLCAFTQVSNALGTITPAKTMIEMAKRHGAYVLLDGAQAVSHMPVNVQDLGCDFYVFSGHKVFAPTGIGAVIAKRELMDRTPPWQGGGNMIADVTFERTRYQPAPARFEAGTGNIADAVGLGAALDWLTRVGIERVERYEHELLLYGTEKLQTVPGLRMVGTAPEKAGVLSFVLEGQKTEDVGGLLDREGIAVRSGHHCAQPILRRYGYEATVRASLAPYNTKEDLDTLTDALKRLQAARR